MNLIRNDINYGDVGLFEINGIQCVLSQRDAEALKAKPISNEDIPAFLEDWTVRAVTGVFFREIYIYVLKKEDILPLGDFIHKEMQLTVFATHHARHLATWLPGQECRLRKLEEFFVELTEKQIEDARLVRA